MRESCWNQARGSIAPVPESNKSLNEVVDIVTLSSAVMLPPLSSMHQ
jgi:hypothetical protein